MFLTANDMQGMGARLLRERRDERPRSARTIYWGPRVTAGGMGAVKPALSRETVAKIKAAGAMVAKKRMLERQAMIAQKLGVSPKMIGLKPNGMGHILSTWQAVKEGEGPFYNPGAEHNERHRTGKYPDMSQYSTDLIEKVKKLNGLSQYEVEHMSPNLLKPLIDKAKAGERVIAPSPQGPPPEPVEAANAALKESVGGKLVLATEKVYDTAAKLAKAPFEFAEWIAKNKKYLIYGGAAVGLGLLAFVVWPYIQAARAPGVTARKAAGG